MANINKILDLLYASAVQHPKIDTEGASEDLSFASDTKWCTNKEHPTTFESRVSLDRDVIYVMPETTEHVTITVCNTGSSLWPDTNELDKINGVYLRCSDHTYNKNLVAPVSMGGRLKFVFEFDFTFPATNLSLVF